MSNLTKNHFKLKRGHLRLYTYSCILKRPFFNWWPLAKNNFLNIPVLSELFHLIQRLMSSYWVYLAFRAKMSFENYSFLIVFCFQDHVWRRTIWRWATKVLCHQIYFFKSETMTNPRQGSHVISGKNVAPILKVKNFFCDDTPKLFVMKTHLRWSFALGFFPLQKSPRPFILVSVCRNSSSQTWACLCHLHDVWVGVGVSR